MDITRQSVGARQLASALEPLAGQVYFAPECHRNYAALGFAGSPSTSSGVEMPDGPAYFTSRGSVLGEVPGEVVAAAFAVFNPEVVVPCVALGWSRTDAATIRQARDDGGIAQLVRLIGEAPQGISRVNDLLLRAVAPLRPEGRALYAGLRSMAVPEMPVGMMWRLSDMLREYRGDSHTAAWISRGITATEISLLSELYWGLPMRSYSRTRAWTPAQFDEAADALRSRRLIDESDLTPAGRALRESIELDTDAQVAASIEALGDDIEELLSIILPWGKTVRAGFGYVSTGLHDLAIGAKSPASI
jgi:hypothetical protein